MPARRGFFWGILAKMGILRGKRVVRKKKEKPARSAGENFAKNKTPENLADLRFSKK